MTTKKVSIEVGSTITVDADTSRAEQKLRNLPQALPETVGHGGAVHPDLHAPSHNPLSQLNQQYFSGLAERMMLSVMPRIPQARTDTQLRDLGDRIERALFNATQSGNKDLVESVTELQKALDHQRREVERTRQVATSEGAGGGGGGLNMGNPFLSGAPGPWNNGKRWLAERAEESALGGLSRYLGGSVGGAAMGGLGRVLGGPAGWVMGGLSAANWAFNAASNAITENNAGARNEVVGYADLARQYGSDRNFMSLFRDERGWTNDRYARLGYTASQASHVAAVFDRPGGMMNDTDQILRFSRSMGMDETRTAGAARTLSLVGVGGRDGGNVGEGLRIIKLAMTEGIKDGIAGSDTMNSLVGLAQKASQEGRSMSAGGLAYYAQVSSRLNDFQSPAMRGQNATNIASGFLKGFGDAGGDPGMEYLLMKGLGELPNAAKLGLKGEEAKGYDALLAESPLEAARSLLKHLEKGENPAIVEQLAQVIDRASGGSAVLKKAMYQQLNPQLSDEQLNSLIGGGGLPMLFKSDKKGLQVSKDGASSTADIQANNNFASDTMYLRVAEQDRELIKSLSSLRLTGGLENRLSELKSSISNLGAIFAQLNSFYAQGSGSMAGSLGSRYKDPGKIPETTVPVNVGSSITRDGPLNGTPRLLAAIAAHESKNGKSSTMNVPGKAAVGLYQMQSQWLLSRGQGANKVKGWAEDAGITMQNPDGSPVTTEPQARAWQLANPTQANKIAEHRIQAIQGAVTGAYAAQGTQLTDTQQVAFTSALWHANGGGDLSAMRRLPLTHPANPLQPLVVGGKLTLNPNVLNDTKPNGDGVSNTEYANLVLKEHSRPSLMPAASGTQPKPLGPAAPGTKHSTDPKQLNSNLNDLHPKFKGQVQSLFTKWAASHPGGLVPTVLEGFRTPQRQQLLYSQGRSPSNPGPIVTAALPGQSAHNHGLAIDVIWVDPQTGRRISQGDPRSIQAYQQLAQIATAQGLHWLGGIGDRPHFEVGGFDGKKAAQGILPKGYRGGGFTGHGPEGEEAGVVHKEEWVANAAITRQHRHLLESLTPTGGAPVTQVKIDLGGVLQINAPMPTEVRSEIMAAHREFQLRVGQSLTHHYSNQGGPR